MRWKQLEAFRSVVRMADRRVVGLALHRSFQGDAAMESVMRKVREGTNRRKFDRLVADDNCM